MILTALAISNAQFMLDAVAQCAVSWRRIRLMGKFAIFKEKRVKTVAGIDWLSMYDEVMRRRSITGLVGSGHGRTPSDLDNVTPPLRSDISLLHNNGNGSSRKDTR
jgi:hypothetical protein